MASYDVEVQVIFWSYILPLLIAILSGVLLKRYFATLYQMGYAAIMDRISHKYNKKLSTRKKQLFDELRPGPDDNTSNYSLTVLEIGAGSGSNFEYYPEGTNVICLDPNPFFNAYLLKNRDEFPHVNIKEFVIGTAEDMSVIPNDSVDAVVCTLVLCSVSDLDLCLKETKRVLRKGGKFLFMEHVRADTSSWLYTLQKLLTPVQKKIADGCQFLGTPWINIEAAGFKSVKLEHFIIKRLMRPNLIGPHIMGIATK